MNAEVNEVAFNPIVKSDRCTRCGLVVTIAASIAVGPGSIPGVGIALVFACDQIIQRIDED